MSRIDVEENLEHALKRAEEVNTNLHEKLVELRAENARLTRDFARAVKDAEYLEREKAAQPHKADLLEKRLAQEVEARQKAEANLQDATRQALRTLDYLTAEVERLKHDEDVLGALWDLGMRGRRIMRDLKSKAARDWVEAYDKLDESELQMLTKKDE